MARKHPSSEQIQSMLREGHFGQSRELPDADPINITQMQLEIDRIEPYDHNPRRERNPLHDEIKESIRAQGGLNNPLTVTRRPGEVRYMVESGGNTRLQILKELWTETGDERFYRIHCLFRPWVSESHVLTAHLIENDKRGALAFIDRALGVRALRQALELEQQESLSQRQLAEVLRTRGYGLDQSMISRMDYAIDVLLPLIPEALRAGMGRRRCDESGVSRPPAVASGAIGSSRRIGSMHFSAMYWAPMTDRTVTRKRCSARWRSESPRSPPSLSSRSASRSMPGLREMTRSRFCQVHPSALNDWIR